jgi:hypothetical protein
MTEKEQEFDRLIRAAAANRTMKGCKCLEAMLQGYRRSYHQDDGCIFIEEPRRKERKTEQGG